ncbi:MAG: hypothetical protein HY049_04455 [Acidobacteria bacterium]|nr:hypothetical protein [Acidobacteriota bacterium]
MIKPLLSLALVAALAWTAAPAQQIPNGPEFQVNAYSSGAQFRPSIARDGAGNFVVVWEDDARDGSMEGIFGRRFASTGAPISGDFQINTYTTAVQYHPAVAMSPSGEFVVVWMSYGQDGSNMGVFGQRFDSAGNAVGGEMQINTYTPSLQSNPKAAMAPDGSFVVAWDSFGEDGSYAGVFGQRFSSSGQPAGSEFQINTTTMYDQIVPRVAADAQGNFLVVWVSHDVSGFDVIGRLYDSGGAPITGEFQVNAYTTYGQFYPGVSMGASGNFVVSWTSSLQDAGTPGVFARRFDSSGTPLTGEFQVNTYTTSQQTASVVAMDGSGGFVVSWMSEGQDRQSFGVFGRRFDSSGAPLGGEFQVNTYTTGYQGIPSVVMDAAGNFTVAWVDQFQDGESWGVFARQFCNDTDGDGLCDAEDILVTSPIQGAVLDCSSPLLTRPTITWDAGNYDRFRVTVATDPSFAAGTGVTSGSGLLTSTSWTPPGKKWKSACGKAQAANPSSPVLFVRVFGVDLNVSKRDPHRKTFSQVVQAGVTP